MSFINAVGYFICKCANLESLQQCIQTGVWACQDRLNPPHPRDLLANAHSQGSVILIYSVNNQRGWHGYAKSLLDSFSESTVNESQSIHFSDKKVLMGNVKQEVPGDSENCEDGNRRNTWYYFKVAWVKHFLDFNKQECLHFESTADLFLPDGAPINKARNWQQVSKEVGRQMCHLIDQHHQKLCLEKQLKVETKLSLFEESFFKQEEAILRTAGWATAVEKVKRELGKVHLVCPFGSQRYNCSVAESDQDIFIVYQAKTTQTLSLDPPRQTIKNSEKLSVDYTVLELQRYCELLLVGDQRCVETLFLKDTEAVYVASPEWKELCSVRDNLLTRSCFEKYMKEAQGNNGWNQLEKWRVSNSETEELPAKLNKVAYICLRLIQNARELISMRRLKVYRSEDSLERTELLETRLGKYKYSEVKSLFQKYLSEIDRLKVNIETDSVSDVKPLVDDWLIRCRLQDLQENPYHPSVK